MPDQITSRYVLSCPRDASGIQCARRPNASQPPPSDAGHKRTATTHARTGLAVAKLTDADDGYRLDSVNEEGYGNGSLKILSTTIHITIEHTVAVIPI